MLLKRRVKRRLNATDPYLADIADDGVIQSSDPSIANGVLELPH